MVIFTTCVKVIENSLKEKIAEYKKKNPSSEKFIIDLKGTVAGEISIHKLNVPYVEHKASISYSLHPYFM